MAWKRFVGSTGALGLSLVVGAACGGDDSGSSSDPGPASGAGGAATGGSSTGGSSTGGSSTGGSSTAGAGGGSPATGGSSTGGSSTAGAGGSGAGGSGTAGAGGSGAGGSGTAGSGAGGAGGSGHCIPAVGPLQTEAVTLQSSDGKSIAGQLRTPELGSCLPGLLLLHQFGSSKAQWAPHVDAFNSAGYLTLAIDIRGHGDSDPADGALTTVLSDPDQAPLDVLAGLDALAGHARVDNSRLAAIGTSIGANLAVVIGTQDARVAAVVPLSPRFSAIEDLLGPEAPTASNLFCWAGELDSGGAQASTCSTLDALATGTSQVEILPGSSAHGTAILSEPGTASSIITWLNTVL